MAKRPTTGASGMKTLITTLSLAAMIGGWAMFTLKDIKDVKPVEVVAPTARVAPPAPNPGPTSSLRVVDLPTARPPSLQPPLPIVITQSSR